MKKALLILPLIGLGFMAKAQYPKVGTTDSISAETLNWYNQSPDNTKVSGVATTKAYTELLSGKKPTKKVIVAVIDSGVDTDHEDLQGQIWINRKEIPGNGIDDDKNGYIDDIHGWNFLGGTDGKLVVNESLELTRIIRDNKSKFDGKTGADVSEGDKELFKMYKRALKEHEKMMANFSQQKEEIDNAKEQYNFNVKLLTIALGKEDFTLTELEEYKPEDSDMIKAKRMVWFFRSKGIDKSLEAASEQVDVYVNYHLNLDFNGRDASGDDHNDLSDVNYGNNNVEGPEADHGTFVSSLIAAKRGNGIGIDGIA
ncbi:MAG: S8 family serine peptidase, partial [Bacteroidia bacterium]